MKKSTKFWAILGFLILLFLTKGGIIPIAFIVYMIICIRDSIFVNENLKYGIYKYTIPKKYNIILKINNLIDKY